MKKLFFLALLASIASTGVPSPAQSLVPTDDTTRQAASGELFQRMVHVNDGLRSYKADLHVDVALKTFPYLSPSLDGSVYYQQPDRQAVVFDYLPSLAGSFKKLYAKIEPPNLWPSVYNFTVVSDLQGTTLFRLVPRKHGRVAHLDVAVDDATATIRRYTWTYEDGGFIAFDQSFTTINGNYLVNGQTGDVELPSYKAKVRSSLTNYHLNVAIDNGVFQNSN